MRMVEILGEFSHMPSKRKELCARARELVHDLVKWLLVASSMCSSLVRIGQVKMTASVLVRSGALINAGCMSK